MSFLRQVFSENGSGSFSRLASLFTIASSIFCLVFIVYSEKKIPDVLTLGGLATFGTFPYGAGKVASTITTVTNNAK